MPKVKSLDNIFMVNIEGLRIGIEPYNFDNFDVDEFSEQLENQITPLTIKLQKKINEGRYLSKQMVKKEIVGLIAKMPNVKSAYIPEEYEYTYARYQHDLEYDVTPRAKVYKEMKESFIKDLTDGNDKNKDKETMILANRFFNEEVPKMKWLAVHFTMNILGDGVHIYPKSTWRVFNIGDDSDKFPITIEPEMFSMSFKTFREMSEKFIVDRNSKNTDPNYSFDSSNYDKETREKLDAIFETDND